MRSLLSAPVPGSYPYSILLWLSLSCLAAPLAHAQTFLANGDAVAGSISPAGDIDSWVFQAGAGETFKVQVGKTGGAGFEPFIRLYGPDNALITSNSGFNSTNITHQAIIAGNYIVEVLDSGSDGAGSYEIFLAKTASSFIVPAGDEGGLLSNGGIHSGVIDLADMDSWQFAADALDTVRIAVGESGTGGLSPLLLLYDPRGNLVASNVGFDTADIVAQVPVGGTYTVVVQDGNTDVTGSGAYNLYFLNTAKDFIVPAGDQGGALVNGDRHSGSIEPADNDAWQFEADALDTVRIAVGESGTGGLSPLLLLYDPQGNLVRSNTGFDTADIVAQVPVGGTYTVVVQDGNTDVTGSGAYNLYFLNTAKDFIVPAGDQGGALVNGGRHSGSIEPADNDAWQFEADALDTVRIAVGESGTGGLSPLILLYDPQGNLLASNSGADAADIVAQVSVSGRYTVVVQDGTTDVTGSGSYNLYFTNTAKDFTVPAGDQGGTLASGDNYSGSIDLADMDIWRFEANALDTVRIAAAEPGGGGLSPLLLLYDPLGNLLTSNVGFNSASIAAQLSTGGAYTLVVQDGNTDVVGSGDYQLYFSRLPASFLVPAGDQGGPLSSGVPETGTIDLGDIDIWSFSAAARDSVTIALNEIAGVGFTPFVLLYDPSGNLIASDADFSSAGFTVQVPIGGSYSVIVQDGNTDVTGSGDYQLSLSLAADNTAEPAGSTVAALSNGDSVSGSIDFETDVDKFSLAVNTGDFVRLKVGDSANTGFFSPVLQVFDAAGALLASGASTTIAEAAFAVTGSQSLTVVVFNSTPTTGVYDYIVHTAISQQSFTVPAADEGRDLSNGGVVAGQLTTADMDLYRLAVTAGDIVRLKLGDTANSGFLSPGIQVFGADGRLIATNNSTTIAEVVFAAGASETLTIIVRNTTTNTGDYAYNLHTAISRQSFSVPAGDQGGVLSNGAIASGQLSTGDMDLYRLAVTAGDFVRLKLGDTANSGFLNPGLQVYAADGSLVATNSSTTIAEVAFSAAAAETLTVVVRNTSASTGDYVYDLHTAISQQSFSTPAGDQGGVLSNGGIASGQLSTGDMDLYRLAVTAGDFVRLKLGDTANSGFLNPGLQVYAADGSLVATNSSTTIAEVTFSVEVGETLTVVVRNTTTSTGDYAYDLHTAISQQSFSTPAGDQGGALGNGAIAAGQLSTGDMDLYRLAVTAGDFVRLKLGDIANSGFLNPGLQVYAADGGLVATNSSTTIAEVAFSAEVGDTLTVVVRNVATSTGDYAYELHTAISQQGFIVPAADQGGVLVDGTTTSGQLSTGDLDIYSLSVAAGDLLSIALEDSNNSGFLNPALSLFRGDGSLLAFASGTVLAQLMLEVPASEALTVVVRNSRTSTGTYDYSINVTGVSGSADTDGDGLLDTDEVIQGTNINRPDTDGDGLSDGDEVNVTGSDPLLADSDGDGILDGFDPAPLNPAVPRGVDEDIPLLPIWAYLLLASILGWIAASRRRQ